MMPGVTSERRKMLHDVNYRTRSKRPARVARPGAPPQAVPGRKRDDWMLEQQLRAVQAWRQLREESTSSPPLRAAAAQTVDYSHSGSSTLKALVRFGLATVGAHVAWIVALASQAGQFEIWLAMAAGFVITLALSMFGAARALVQLLAEAAAWMIVAAVALSSVWLTFQFLS